MITKFAGAKMSIFGYGCRKEITSFITREKKCKALIVTDETLEKLGIVKMITDVLNDASILYATYNKVLPNPTVDNVKEGTNIYRTNNCDFIIAIGGGSANDCAKAIGVMSTNDGDILDYVGGNKAKNKIPLLIGVNTTAGTGAEISRAYLLSSESTKHIFKDDYVMPEIAVNDIEMMMNLPKNITAQTGMDALTHAIEGYISTGSSKITNIMNKEAIKLLYKNLTLVTSNLSDEEARENMSLGQYLAGLGFGSAGLGLVHAMSHQLSALYHTPHGLANAILLPEVLRFYKETCEKKFSEILYLIDPEFCKNNSESDCAIHFIELIDKLSSEVGTKVALRDISVVENDFELLSEKALKDGCIFSSPKIPSKDEITTIYKNIY